jgi:hypothetical protein
MATLNKPVPGGDIGTWGTKINAALDALNAELIGTTSTATSAETPTGSQSKANAAQAAAIAASEPKVPRTGASTGWIATLKADGTIYFTQPAAGTTLPDASTGVKGLVRLAGALGGTADAPTTPTAVHVTGNETIDGVKTFTAVPQVPDGSFTVAKIAGSGTRDATTVLTGAGTFVTPPASAALVYGCVVPWVADAAGAYGTRTRPAGVVWAFLGPNDPGALMSVDGDTWDQTPA